MLRWIKKLIREKPKVNIQQKNIDEVYDIGIEEYLDNAFLCIIEWPEVYEEEFYGLKYHKMSINNTGEQREISFD